MIFILEGPDGAGKTTLAEQLAVSTGYNIVHRTKPNNEEEKQQMMAMYMDAMRKGTNAIFDRCWYSEMVYGAIMRDASYISDKQMRTLESLLANNGGLIIHCTDTIDRLWERCLKRGEDYITDCTTIGLIKMKFEYVMHSLPHAVPVVRYSISDQQRFYAKDL